MSRLAIVDLLLRDAAALLIVKATVVLALATAAAAAAKGFSAARRHLLWLVALLSCVGLVLSSPLVPAIMIRMPMLAQGVTIGARPTAAAVPSSHNASAANASRVWRRFPAIETVRRSPVRSVPLPRHPLIALWIIGSVALLGRHAIGFVGATRLARRASIANDDQTRELARVTAALGLRGEVRLGYSTEVKTPITFDVGKPYVLLPTEARSWSIERRRAGLVHETAHIARADWLSQAIGQLACELFWFHPLVWRAFARLRDEAERGADDCVLRSGMPAFEYAAHLLALAQPTTNRRPDLVAIGIVSTNDLERRFVDMFDTTRCRATVTSRARAVTTSVALAIVCPLASLRIVAPAQPMNAPLPHVSTPQPASAAYAGAAPAATHPRESTRAPRPPEVRVEISGQQVPETSQWSIAVVDHPAPSPVAHPNFSGKWRVDTVTDPLEDTVVNDSTIIAQSENAISLESRGHVLDVPTYGRIHDVSFDGAESTGVVATGNVATNFAAYAVWVADTLVLKSYAHAGAHDALTYERFTLGADGQTLVVTNTSFADGRRRWGGPRTFVLRRVTP